MNGLPKESKDIIDWGIRKYKEYLSANYKTRKLEVELFADISSNVNLRKYFKKSEVRKIMSWRRPTTPNFIEKNSESRVNTITKEALESSDEEIKIYTLTLLHGVGITSASKLLMISNPDKYVPLNKINWEIFSRWNYLETPFNDTTGGWLKFTDVVDTLTKKFEVSGRELDQSLVALYLRYGMDEFESTHIPLDHFFR